MTIKEMRKAAGMSQQKFSEYFNIPKRTIEAWESGVRVPPDYVPSLIEYKLEKEGFFDATENALKKIMEANARMLNVGVPRLAISPRKFFKTPTMRAALVGCENLNDVVLHVNEKYLKELKTDAAQAWLTVSHEMRHLWQLANGATLDGYATSDNVDTKAYNAQDLEVDAWAWATIAVVQNVGVSPDFKNALGEQLHNAIMKRASCLLEEIE